MRHSALLLLAALATAPAIEAQIQIDKSRPAKPKGEVRVENAFGSLAVIAWDKDEISVTGTLAAGAEGLDFDGDDGQSWVGVSVPDAWFYESDDDTEYRTDLVVHVPRGSALAVQTTNASIRVDGVDGELHLESVNGAISAQTASKKIEIDTMTGVVDVSASGAEMEAESISGAVTLRGAAGSVSVKTTSGSIDVSGEKLAQARIETTTGDVRLAAGFVETGEVEIETFDGQVELILPADVKGRFECVTFSGQIQNAFGPKPRREGRFTPFSQLNFSTGLNEFDVSIETYSGDILLHQRSGAAR
jgi:hypothetical protein